MCKKELMCDREKAIRRCEDKQYRMERQLQQMERRLEKVEREEKARDRKKREREIEQRRDEEMRKRARIEAEERYKVEAMLIQKSHGSGHRGCED